MFVVLLQYTKSIDEIDRHLEAHREFLKEQYAQKRFLASGPCLPRTGGVILARGGDRAELERLIEADPFKREGVAEYTLIEFDPVMRDPALDSFC